MSASRNERIKNFANLVNVAGVGLTSYALIKPAFSDGNYPAYADLWFLAGVALFALAHYALGSIKGSA